VEVALETRRRCDCQVAPTTFTVFYVFHSHAQWPKCAFFPYRSGRELVHGSYASVVIQVSLDGRVREVIGKNLLNPTSHAFDDAQSQIYTLMQRDSYPRFLASRTFGALLQAQ